MHHSESTHKNSSKLTNWVRYLLYAQVFIAVISIYSNYLEYQFLSDFQNGLYSSQEQAFAASEANDKRNQLIFFAYLLVFIVSGFLILRWIHRANSIARQLGAQGMRFTPGWSIGYYFIPILSLWKPYQAMQEIWQASHNPKNWSAVQPSSILGLWWFFWLAKNIFDRVFARMSLRVEDIQGFLNLNIAAQVSEVMAITLALVTLSIVNSIYQAQNNAYARN